MNKLIQFVSNLTRKKTFNSLINLDIDEDGKRRSKLKLLYVDGKSIASIYIDAKVEQIFDNIISSLMKRRKGTNNSEELFFLREIVENFPVPFMCSLIIWSGAKHQVATLKPTSIGQKDKYMHMYCTIIWGLIRFKTP